MLYNFTRSLAVVLWMKENPWRMMDAPTVTVAIE